LGWAVSDNAQLYQPELGPKVRLRYFMGEFKDFENNGNIKI